MERVHVRDAAPRRPGERDASTGPGPTWECTTSGCTSSSTASSAALRPRVVEVDRVEQQPARRGLRRRGADRVRPGRDRGDAGPVLGAEREDVDLVPGREQPLGEPRRVLLCPADDLRRPEVGDHQHPHRYGSTSTSISTAFTGQI